MVQIRYLGLVFVMDLKGFRVYTMITVRTFHLVCDNNDFHRVSKIVPSFSQLFELVMKAVIDARRRGKTQSKNELVL